MCGILPHEYEPLVTIKVKYNVLTKPKSRFSVFSKRIDLLRKNRENSQLGLTIPAADGYSEFFSNKSILFNKTRK